MIRHTLARFQSPVVAEKQELRLLNDEDETQALGIMIPNKRKVQLGDTDFDLYISSIDIIIPNDRTDYFTINFTVTFPHIELDVRGQRLRKGFILGFNRSKRRDDESIIGCIQQMATLVDAFANEDGTICATMQYRDKTDGHVHLRDFIRPIEYIVNPSKGLADWEVPHDEGASHHISIDDMYAAQVHLIDGDVLVQDGYEYKVRGMWNDNLGGKGTGFCLIQLFGKQEKFIVSIDPSHNAVSKEFNSSEGLFYASDSDSPEALATYNRLKGKFPNAK